MKKLSLLFLFGIFTNKILASSSYDANNGNTVNSFSCKKFLYQYGKDAIPYIGADFFSDLPNDGVLLICIPILVSLRILEIERLERVRLERERERERLERERERLERERLERLGRERLGRERLGRERLGRVS